MDHATILAESAKEVYASAEKINALVLTDTNENADLEKEISEKIEVESALLNDALANYAKHKETAVFAKLMEEPIPMKAAFVMQDYKILSARFDEDGTVEINERTKGIDFPKFSKKAGVKMDWVYKAYALSKEIFARHAIEIGVSSEALKDIDDTYAMAKIARDINMGKRPASGISNNAIVKTLQEILDIACFEDNGNGENMHKVLKKDAAFVYKTAIVKDKKSRKQNGIVGIASVGNKEFLLNVCESFWYVILGKEYGINFKRQDNKNPAALKNRGSKAA